MNFDKILATLRAVAASIWHDLAPLAAKIKPIVLAAEEEIATVALNAVAFQATQVLSGKAKLSNATNTVINSLGEQGKSIGAAAAQAAVQTAYNFLAEALHQPVK